MKNSPLNSYISLYSPLGSSEDSTQRETLADTLLPNELMNPEDILIDRENVTDIQSAIEEKLSPFEKRVVELYIDGCSYQQIAKSLSKSPKSIDYKIILVQILGPLNCTKSDFATFLWISQFATKLFNSIFIDTGAYFKYNKCTKLNTEKRIFLKRGPKPC